MARNVYKLDKNKLNSKSELNSKADSVVLTNFKAIEEDAFVEEMKENKAESVYKLNNNKSELDSKADSVILTNFKAIEEDTFVEEKKETQEVKNEGCLDLIVQSLSRKFEKFREKNEMIKELKDLEQFLEKIKNERKDLLEFYTNMIKIQELEKAELEKAVKDYNFLETSYNLENPSPQFEYDEMQDPSFEKIKNEEKDLLEFYTDLMKIQEREKKELEKINEDFNLLKTRYNIENTSTQIEYDEMQDPYVNESEEEELESTRL